MTSTAQTLSIVVPTRNRAEHAAECARAILRWGGFDELIFVDQSDRDETERALNAIGDKRLRCIRSELRGATNGRNVGIEASSGALLAFTDDDCRVAPDWTASIRRIFADDPTASVICGRVHVPEEMQKDGFAIAFEPQVREWSGRYPPPSTDWGITANLSARRSVLDEVGKFDPMLGPGAPLRCGEEPDLLFRVLKAGHKVVNAKEVQVEHLGVRAHGEESSQLWDTYGAGTAAALFKHIRLGDLDAAGLYLRHLGVMSRVVTGNLLRGRRPIGLRYTRSFLSGALASFRFAIDRRTRIYRSRKTSRSGSSA
jgi:glycosyltransferase involved in cell wall biosynthesis